MPCETDELEKRALIAHPGFDADTCKVVTHWKEYGNSPGVMALGIRSQRGIWGWGQIGGEMQQALAVGCYSRKPLEAPYEKCVMNSTGYA